MPRATTRRSYDLRRSSARAGPRSRRVVVPPRLRSPIAPPTIRIEVEGRTWEAPLPPRPVRVGAGASCDLRLGCDGVGTEHCVLEPLPDGRHVVRDLSSGRPTRVNGLEIHQVSLRAGDAIEVGEARIVYGEAAGAAAAPPPSSAGPAADRAAASATNGRRPARTPAPSAAAPSRGAGARLTGPLVALAAAAAVALGLAFVVGGDSTGTDTASAERRLERALDLYRAQDYEGARDALLALAEDPRASAVNGKIERYLRLATEAIQDAEAELDRFWAQRLDFDLQTVDTTRQVFLQRHGAMLAERFDRLVARIDKAQATWSAERVGEAREEAAAMLRGELFAEARAPWLALRDEQHAGVRLEDAVAEGLREVDAAATESAEKLLAAAEQAAKEKGPSAAVRKLGARASAYAGTPVHRRLLEALADYRARARATVSPTAPARPTEPTPGPTAPTPEPGAAAREAAAAALARADEAAQGWEFAGALDALDAALGALPEGSDAHGRVTARRDDLALALRGLDALVEDVAARPERYRRVEMAPKFFVSLVRADRETVTGTVRGGETRYRWAALSPPRAVGVVRRMKAEGEVALALAALVREVAALDDADPLLLAAGEGGVEPAALYARIARWRGETVPKGGYVPHDDRYVRPEEKERLVLLARIEDAAGRVRHRDARVWKEAAEELLALGPTARGALVDALTARRSDVIAGLSGLRTFTSGRTKSKLFDELEKRRAHALSLIRDGQAWPYPNPSGRNTDEVVARVDAVREIWERPFDVIVQWSSNAKEALATVSEVDEYLVRADPEFKPSLDELREKVNRAVDMPSYAPSSKAKSLRQYSLKVLAFNEKVPTTATREEKGCVLAVNEYRMMMGHRAVKINERLVRAARGHSRHMRTNGYFAHNVPAGKGATGENRTPGNRAGTQGYGGGVGENIARGTWTGRDAFWAWFHSSGHHRNMVSPGWTEMGAGRSGGDWWTQLFGAKNGRSLDVPDALPEPAEAFAPEPEDEQGRPARPGRPELPDEPPVVPPDWPEDVPEEDEGEGEAPPGDG